MFKKTRRFTPVSMSEEEQREWVELLGKTPEQQAEAIKELLDYSHVDDMSSEDRIICRNQLARLNKEIAHANKA